MPPSAPPDGERRAAAPLARVEPAAESRAAVPEGGPSAILSAQREVR